MSSEVTEIEEHDAFSVLGEALESAAEKFGDLTASARDSARSAAHTVQKAVGTSVYKGSYGVSFGLVFGAVFLTELLPEGNALRRGLTDGAEAGIISAKSKSSSRHGLPPDDVEHAAFPKRDGVEDISAPLSKTSPTGRKRASAAR